MRRFRHARLLRFALLALTLHVLLPFVHAAQMLDAQRDAIGHELCSALHHDGASSPTDPAPPGTATPGMTACPLCAAVGGQQLAIAFALPALAIPPVPHRLQQIPAPDGVVVPAPVFVRPPSHAPPVRFA